MVRGSDGGGDNADHIDTALLTIPPSSPTAPSLPSVPLSMGVPLPMGGGSASLIMMCRGCSWLESEAKKRYSIHFNLNQKRQAEHENPFRYSALR